jgi:hypothetical protein
VHLIGRDAVVLHDHVELVRRGGNDLFAGAVDFGFLADALAEVVLLLELRRVVRRIELHQLFFPQPEGVGRVDVRHVEGLGEAPGGVAGVPVMAVEELVLEPVLPDPAQRILRPFVEVADEVFLADKFRAAAGDADDADPLVDDIDLGLVLEAAGPDVDLIAQLGEFFGQFDDIDDLAAGVGGAERRLGRDVAVGRDHANARER